MRKHWLPLTFLAGLTPLLAACAAIDEQLSSEIGSDAWPLLRTGLIAVISLCTIVILIVLVILLIRMSRGKAKTPPAAAPTARKTEPAAAIPSAPSASAAAPTLVSFTPAPAFAPLLAQVSEPVSPAEPLAPTDTVPAPEPPTDPGIPPVEIPSQDLSTPPWLAEVEAKPEPPEPPLPAYDPYPLLETLQVPALLSQVNQFKLAKMGQIYTIPSGYALEWLSPTQKACSVLILALSPEMLQVNDQVIPADAARLKSAIAAALRAQLT